MGSLQPITSNQKLIIIKVIMEVQEKYRTIENTKETEEESNLVEISFDALELNFQDELSRRTLDSSNENLFQTGRLNKADLQWRFSIPFLCLVSSILAFPLSRVKPRQGRFNRILPSILVFMSYLGLLLLVRGWIQQGLWPSFPGLLVIHALFLIIALLLLLRNSKLGRGS